jgi:hypothetical protein
MSSLQEDKWEEDEWEEEEGEDKGSGRRVHVSAFPRTPRQRQHVRASADHQ